jgi:hypothetical protein
MYRCILTRTDLQQRTALRSKDLFVRTRLLRMMNTKELLQSIDEEIARLTKARDLLSNNSKAAPAAKGRSMSLEARKRIAAAQRKRWAAVKKAV